MSSPSRTDVIPSQKDSATPVIPRNEGSAFTPSDHAINGSHADQFLAPERHDLGQVPAGPRPRLHEDVARPREAQRRELEDEQRKPGIHGVLGAMKLQLTPDNKRLLADAYLHLAPWPDTADALRRLKESGTRLITIANFSPAATSLFPINQLPE